MPCSWRPLARAVHLLDAAGLAVLLEPARHRVGRRGSRCQRTRTSPQTSCATAIRWSANGCCGRCPARRRRDRGRHARRACHPVADAAWPTPRRCWAAASSAPTCGPAAVTIPTGGRGDAARRRALALGALLAVVGPGLLAGLSDDDPAGITTYSVLGADHGYQLLWVLLLSTVALVMFHGLAARMGVVTGQGLIGLVRQRYGVRSGGAALAALVVANIGTTCAEFAGIAAGFELFGISRYAQRPRRRGARLAAGAARQLPPRRARPAAVVDGVPRLHRLGRAGPPRLGRRRCTAFWSRACPRTARPSRSSPPPSAPRWRRGASSFIQSYAVDKKLRTDGPRPRAGRRRHRRRLTGVIGFFVVVACAATLAPRRPRHRRTRPTPPLPSSRSPVARPATLFAVGLIGAAFLAASVLPLSTAYSVCEYAGVEAAVGRPVPRGQDLLPDLRARHAVSVRSPCSSPASRW